MDYWHKLTKRFTIKITLPHLLLGVIATAFSLSVQAGLPANSSQANIIPIAAVIVTLHKHQSNNQIKSVVTVHTQHKLIYNRSSSSLSYNKTIFAIRLTPNNGIRAGPFPLIA